ncbi:MAG: HAD family phosphatase [Treponema sp.]|jgi:putative hydrolase of the HAD superfamily|nr:HAD family phosphatase [Treponema sp.]
MKIKAVVFDYGKVICFPPEHGVMDSLAALAGVEKKALERMIWKYRDNYDRGTEKGPFYYQRIVRELGKDISIETGNAMAEIDMAGWKNINSATVKLMEDIKKAGILLGILSNMPFEFLDWARKELPVFSLPQAGVFSCEEGLIKPEEAIYRKLLEKLNCLPGEVVFFDDIAQNVNKARELKIEAFVWESPEKARELLTELGVAI